MTEAAGTVNKVVVNRPLCLPEEKWNAKNKFSIEQRIIVMMEKQASNL